MQKRSLYLTGAAIALAVTFAAQTCQAYLLAYEGFDYTPGSDLSGMNGGFGWTTPWGVASGSITTNGNAIGDTVATGSLSYFSGNRALFTTGNSGFYSGALGTSQPFRDFFNASPGEEGTTIWVSFLAARSGPTTNNTGTPFNPYPRAANVSLFNTGERLAIGSASGMVSNNWALLPSGSGGNARISGNNFSLLSFAVVRIDYGATNNDTAYLFINPQLGTEPTLSSAVAMTNNFDFSFFRVRPFAGGNDAANSRPYAELSVDEIRIGTTWQDVAPFITLVPEPSTAALASLGLLAWVVRRRK